MSVSSVAEVPAISDQAAVRALGALAHDTRLAVFRALVGAGPAGVPAGRLAALLGVAGPTLTFHLKELERAGLVRPQRAGRLVLYSADFAAMRQLLGFLLNDCCGGRPEICDLPGPRTGSCGSSSC